MFQGIVVLLIFGMSAVAEPVIASVAVDICMSAGFYLLKQLVGLA